MLFAVFALVVPLVAGRAAKSAFSTCVSEQCMTRYATEPVGYVATTTRTSTNTVTWTVTSTITPTIKVTPAPSTTTSTSTAISTITSTAPSSTDVTTSTVVVMTTKTKSSTTTTTITSSVTVLTTTTKAVDTTTTVATVAGFTPIASVPSVEQYGSTEYQSKKRSLQSRKRDHLGHHDARSEQCTDKFPAAVTCTKVVDIYVWATKTVTASYTSTVTAHTRPEVTTRTTITREVTKTVTPAATTSTTTHTSTETERTVVVSTVTNTTTLTTTSTSTSYAAFATLYDACSSNNLIDAAGGYRLSGYAGGTFVGSSATDADGCCASCQTADFCVGFAFSLEAESCTLITDSGASCNGADDVWTFYDNFQNQKVMGNGNCGQGGFDYALGEVGF